MENNGRITVNALPTVMNGVSFGIVMRSYFRYVHNRPFAADLSVEQKAKELKFRNRSLAAFAIIGAPLTVYLLRISSITNKDMFTVTYDLPSSTESSANNLNKSGL